VRAVAWWCARCLRESGRRKNGKLCQACHAAGWRWCGLGRHVVSTAVHVDWRAACRPCYNASRRHGGVRWAHKAGEIGYSPGSVRRLARKGKIPAFQRTPRGPWYVEVPS
jgi:hypothetical protein